MTKRLMLDIETSHFIAATFSLYPNYISHDNILQDWYIICAAWKWEGSDKIYSEKTYNTNDKKVVSRLREAIIEADELVYHNGKKFDYKKLNARIVLNGLPPMPKPRETDTLLQCRKHFAFTCNRLDYIGKILFNEGKIKTDNELWLRALNKDRQAIDYMLEYNIQDVLLLEKVFLKLKPYIDCGVNENINQQFGDKCRACASSNLQSRGWAYTNVNKYRRYQCKDCGKWSQSGNAEKRNIIPVR